MDRKAIAARRRQNQKRKGLKRILLFGGLAAVVLIVVGVIAWPALRPAEGEAVPIFSRDHVEKGTDPGPYRTDPPAGGKHYAEPLAAGFYDDADVDGLGQYPEGHLVHSLEHGYVIFWYNCDLLDETDCEELKSGIREVMAGFDNYKVIGFPWPSIETPVVLTSWGRILRMEAFNARQARSFVSANQNKAPEPGAP